MSLTSDQGPIERLETLRMYLGQVQALQKSVELGYPGDELRRHAVLSHISDVLNTIRADIQMAESAVNVLFGVQRAPAFEHKEKINKFEIKYFKCDRGCGRTMPNSGTCLQCSREKPLIHDSLLSEELKPIVNCNWCKDGRDLTYGESCPNCHKIGKYKFIE